MARLTLQYAEDPATGLPRLAGRDADLSAADLEVLSREINRQFERLATGPDGQVLALNGLAGSHLPHYFRVTVTERGKRCPTLLLEAADSPEIDGAPAASAASPSVPLAPLPQPWQGQFLAEAAERLAAAAGESAARSPLDFVLADLRALQRKDPDKFTLLLFAGYLYVGDALSLKYGESGDNPYARAAWDLTERAGASLPEGALGPLLPQPGAAASDLAAPPDMAACGLSAPPSAGPTEWLRQFFSFS